MRRIDYFEPEEFLGFILSKIEMTLEGPHTNLQHTHDRVHYNPETGQILVEEVCIDQDGACFGRNVYGSAIIPIGWNQFLPEKLLNSPYWGDFYKQ